MGVEFFEGQRFYCVVLVTIVLENGVGIGI